MSELPKGWLNTPLPEIAGITMGQSPDSSDCNDIGIGMPFFQGKAEFQKLYPEVRKYCTKPKKIAKKDDVLLSVRAPVGPTNLAESECVIGRGLAAINSHELAHKYLLYYFRYIEPWLSEQGTGSTFKAIGGQFLKELSVKLAPQAEQTRIVEKLDEVLAQVDTIKARLDGIPAILKRFRQSVLAAAVSGRLTEEWRGTNSSSNSLIEYLERLDSIRLDEYNDSCTISKEEGNRKPRKPSTIDNEIFANPEWVDKFASTIPISWVVKYIGYIGQNNADSIVDGPFGASINVKTDYIEAGVPVIRINNINPFEFDGENLKYISAEKFSDLKRHNVQGGDILLGKVGTIGNACIYPVGFPEGMLSTTGSTRIRVDPRVVITRYAELYLNAQKAAFNEIASAAVQPFLNMKTIKSFPFILPPLEEQKEIARLVEQYFAFADTIESQVKKAQTRVDNLTQSILAKAFRGELVAQDPDDEPAEKLLERIAQARKEAEALAKAAKKVAKTK